MKQKKRKLNKKGNFDLILIVCLGFVLAVSFFFISKVWNEMRPQLMNEDPGSTATGADALEQVNTTINGMDIVFGIVFFGLLIGAIVLSSMVQTHPVMFFVAIFVLLVTGMLAMKFGNIFEEISSSPEMTNQTQTFQATQHIMDNYPTYIIIMSFIIFIILYAKWKGSGGGIRE